MKHTLIESSLTTYERLTKDPKRKAKIEKEYKQLLFSELLIARIKYWAKIGKIAKMNPDLTYGFINSILMAQQEAQKRELEPYEKL